MTPKQPQKRLGRGLSSLISPDLSAVPAARDSSPTAAHAEQFRPGTAIPTANPAPVTAAPPPFRMALLKVGEIRTNPLQPRKVFDPQRLAELSASIKAKGTIQPIVVRPAEGGYELIAGERRLRATTLAGLDEIPAIIRSVTDENLLELAIIENTQRADLNPIERARAYALLAEKYRLTHEQVADRVGEDRATVSNYIRLLGLGADIINALQTGEISVGHAKVLLSISDIKYREQIAHRLMAEAWSVRRLEKEIAGNPKPANIDKQKEPKRPAVRDLEERLRAALGGAVAIHESRRKHTGRIVLEYYSLDDFERIVRRLGVDVEEVG